MILTLLGLIPYFMNLFNVVAQPPGLIEGAQEQQFSQLMGSMLIVVGVFALAMLVYFLVFSWFIAVKGQTPGMRILGLRLVSVHTGQPVGWKLALLRSAVLILGNQFTGGILGLLFWLSPLFDTQSGWNQSWQDKMLKAVLTTSRKAGTLSRPSPRLPACAPKPVLSLGMPGRRCALLTESTPPPTRRSLHD